MLETSWICVLGRSGQSNHHSWWWRSISNAHHLHRWLYDHEAIDERMHIQWPENGGICGTLSNASCGHKFTYKDFIWNVIFMGDQKWLRKIMQAFWEMKDVQCQVDRMSTNGIKGFFPYIAKFEVSQKDHAVYHFGLCNALVSNSSAVLRNSQ